MKRLEAESGLKVPPPALEAAQGQMDGFFCQLPYACHFEEVASVGDCLEICPQLDSRVEGFGCPHGGLQPAFQKSTGPEKIDFQALSARMLVTYHADFRGNEVFVVHRVEGCLHDLAPPAHPSFPVHDLKSKKKRNGAER